MDLLEPEELEAMGRAYASSLRKLAHRQLKLADSQEITLKSASAWGPSASSPHSSSPEISYLQVDAARAAAELQKIAAVSTDTARRSLDRLDTLERNKPNVGQVARYGGIGALGGAGAGALGNIIEHGTALRGATPKAKALNLVSSAAKGAIGGGALPLLRSHSDRHTEMGTLKKFMQENSNA